MYRNLAKKLVCRSLEIENKKIDIDLLRLLKCQLKNDCNRSVQSLLKDHSLVVWLLKRLLKKKDRQGCGAGFFHQALFLLPGKIDDLLWGHVERDWIDFGGTKRDRMVFGEIDLANAKEKIDTMMENNSDYKKSIIEEYPYYFKFGHGVKNPKQTILDKVFFHLFNGDEDRRGSVVRVDFSDNALNLIKLIQ